METSEEARKAVVTAKKLKTSCIDRGVEDL